MFSREKNRQIWDLNIEYSVDYLKLFKMKNVWTAKL
jgi:hypothetical protein